MSVSIEPKIYNFQAGGAITAKTLVKFGADDSHVVACGANDKSLGVFMGDADAVSGDFVEVAMFGGGALLKISETVVRGQRLTPTAAGLGEVVDAAGEEYGAQATESGSANDIIAVVIISGKAQAAE